MKQFEPKSIRPLSVINDCWARMHEEQKIQSNMFELLDEMYVKYDMSWVDDFIDDLYDDVSDSEIFKKYKIQFKFEPSPENSLVVKSVYTSAGIYEVIFNSNLIASGAAEKYKMALSLELKRAFVHEDTHRQQDQPGFDMSKVPGPDGDSKAYMSSPSEIAARGREVALILEPQGLKQAMENIETEKNLGLASEVVHWYHKIGGSVYHKFLSEIYRYLYGED